MKGTLIRRTAPLVFLLVVGLSASADPPHTVFDQRVALSSKGPLVDASVDARGNLRITTAQGSLGLFLAADLWLAFDEGDMPTWDPSSLEFVDVTFDGLADLKVLVARGAYNFIYQYWAWNPTQQKFLPLPGLEEITNPVFDEKARTLVSFHKVRGYGDLWVRREFGWSGKAWITGEETERQMVDENVEGSGYLLIHRRLQKGAWVEVSREPSGEDEDFLE